MIGPQHIPAHTTHARRGAVRNAFRYSVDFVLIDPEDDSTGPALFSRTGINLAAVPDRHHGGARGAGNGPIWARDTLDRAGLTGAYDLRLLTQPRVLGMGFNPVSFWLAMRADTLVTVIAEVNNTFGDRHCYLCHLPDFRAITPRDRIKARKLMHVSPFQDVAGAYAFHFDLTPARISIRIAHENGADGVIATLTGPRAPLTNRAILWSLLRRPFGALRTVALIFWQALKLRLKGARYRARPIAPKTEVTRCSSSQNV
ncbi:MAG: DUF1365 domain-containing protein [Thalassovita sp.]